MERVYIVISVYNGYKQIHDVFGSQEKAMEYIKQMKEDYFHFGEHEFYVMNWNVR